MVWFQCEDCGDNLKKPKLPNHFRMCSASKLSCIDCGEVFGQHNVENHTQCITEAEKYGPKGQGKDSNAMKGKPKGDAKPKPEVDINVGLSERPPWFCSLCNTKATSKQTLLLHADGKKHRAKARAYHASKQQPNNAVENKDHTESNGTNKAPEDKVSGQSRDQDSSKVSPQHDGTGDENDSKSNKKRKLETSENGGSLHKAGADISIDLGNGEVIHVKRAETVMTEGLKKAKHPAIKEDAKFDSSPNKDLAKKKIKWKKIISSTLQSSPDGVLKFKKLRKLVLKSLKESGFTEDKSQVSEILEHKINSSSKFTVDGKYVRLATSS